MNSLPPSDVRSGRAGGSRLRIAPALRPVFALLLGLVVAACDGGGGAVTPGVLPPEAPDSLTVELTPNMAGGFGSRGSTSVRPGDGLPAPILRYRGGGTPSEPGMSPHCGTPCIAPAVRVSPLSHRERTDCLLPTEEGNRPEGAEVRGIPARDVSTRFVPEYATTCRRRSAGTLGRTES